MGPFGMAVLLPMFPELRQSFGVSSQAIGWGFTAYLLPFAALLLVSGTLGERWGRSRTVRSTYLLYAIASIMCACAPNLTVFLLGRSLQGVANAFITPLLLAGLAEITPSTRFGRNVGIYSSFQALGGALAPIIGGVAADASWRAAFWGTAILSFALSLLPPSGEPRTGTNLPPIRPLFKKRILLLGLAALAASMGPMGISILVGVAARDSFHVSGSSAGLILLSGAAAPFLLGPFWGQTLDRFGYKKTPIIASIGVTASACLLATASSPWALAAIWFLVGGLVGFLAVVLQALAVTEVEENRGGALSFVLAFRFLGLGLVPVVWLSPLEESYVGTFLGASSLGLITILIMIRNSRVA